MKACLFMLCCLLTDASLAQDHLTPGVGYYATYSDNDVYHRLVREKLFAGLGYQPLGMARVVVFPSFSPEYLVAVEKDHLEYYLIFRTCPKSIWAAHNRQTGEMAPLPLIEKKVEISEALGQRLNEFLFIVVSQARYPAIEYITFTGHKPSMAFPVRVDGTTYRFVTSVPDSDVRSGETYSPEAGSLMAGLVDVVELMASVAKGVSQEVDLVLAVEKLQKRQTRK